MAANIFGASEGCGIQDVLSRPTRRRAHSRAAVRDDEMVLGLDRGSAHRGRPRPSGAPLAAIDACLDRSARSAFGMTSEGCARAPVTSRLRANDGSTCPSPPHLRPRSRPWQRSARRKGADRPDRIVHGGPFLKHSGKTAVRPRFCPCTTRFIIAPRRGPFCHRKAAVRRLLSRRTKFVSLLDFRPASL